MKGDKITFTDRLIQTINEKKSILVVGLDPQLKFMPPHLVGYICGKYGGGNEGVARLFYQFNKEIIDAVSTFVVAVKPNIAFYEKYGHFGILAFEQTIKYAHKKGLLVITDAKRGDGGDTAEAYADAHLGRVSMLRRTKDGSFSEFRHKASLLTDALTINAYIGSSCVNPFLAAVKNSGKGIFVVDKTSFTPNSEIEQITTSDGPPLWMNLAVKISDWAKGTEGKYGYENLGVVMGATYPADAENMRKILPKAFFLIPGYGAQGGGADGAVVGVNQDGYGGVVNSSRAIIAVWQGKVEINPEGFTEAVSTAAEHAKNDLNDALKRVGKCPWLNN